MEGYPCRNEHLFGGGGIGPLKTMIVEANKGFFSIEQLLAYSHVTLDCPRVLLEHTHKTADYAAILKTLRMNIDLMIVWIKAVWNHPLYSARKSVDRALNFLAEFDGLGPCSKLETCPPKNLLVHVGTWFAEVRDAAYFCLVDDLEAPWCFHCQGAYYTIMLEMSKVKNLANIHEQHRLTFREMLRQDTEQPQFQEYHHNRVGEMIQQENRQIFQVATQLMSGMDGRQVGQGGYNMPVEARNLGYQQYNDYNDFNRRQELEFRAAQYAAQQTNGQWGHGGNSERAAFYEVGGAQMMRQEEDAEQGMVDLRDRRVSEREYGNSCFAFEHFLAILEEEYKESRETIVQQRIKNLVLDNTHEREQQTTRTLHSLFDRQLSSIRTHSAPELEMFYEQGEQFYQESGAQFRQNGAGGQQYFGNPLPFYRR